MSFDDITLPKNVITELYKDHLVEVTVKEAKKNETSEGISLPPTSRLEFLGENFKNILVIVHYQDFVYLPEEQLDFLTKILSACKLTIKDIAIINTAKVPAHMENIKVLDTKSVLLFGEVVSDVVDRKKMEYFAPIFKEGVTIMIAPCLENLSLTTNEGKQLKSKLWLSLQQFFNL